jgi:uncharacterized membrane protein
MASHWNGAGNVDGYMSRFWGVFLMPIISLFMFLLFMLIPKIDPMKKNVEKFRNYFDWCIVLIMLFMLYLYILTLLWNFSYRFNMVLMLVPAFGILFYYMGVLVSHAKRNWFIGIRTPWTMSSSRVWDKTHRLGGILFKISGAIALLGVIFQKYAIWLVIVPAVIAALWATVYSYFAYRKNS